MCIMFSTGFSDIDTEVRRSLEGTKFEAREFERLPGGSVNWVFLVKLSVPLEDGTTEVLVKHGESRMATKPEFPLDMLRCVWPLKAITRSRRLHDY